MNEWKMLLNGFGMLIFEIILKKKQGYKIFLKKIENERNIS